MPATVENQRVRGDWRLIAGGSDFGLVSEVWVEIIYVDEDLIGRVRGTAIVVREGKGAAW
jgi:hypothetical protein